MFTRLATGHPRLNFSLFCFTTESVKKCYNENFKILNLAYLGMAITESSYIRII